MEEADFIAFTERQTSFVAGLRPQDALSLSFATAIELLRSHFGAAVDIALSQEATDARVPGSELSRSIRSPRSSEGDGRWMRRTNIVGLNVRTVGTYAGVIKYVLTLPAVFDSIHLLPLWEPGVAGSLYGPASWNLNPEFTSEEMAAWAPYLDTSERQLRATTNLLHVMGRSVGMDVIPHADRFSEMSLANPGHFEWMRVEGGAIRDHSTGVGAEVAATIFGWLQESGPAVGPPDGLMPQTKEELFALDEPARLELLFGVPADRAGRDARRLELLMRLKWFGFEPVPATMGVPFRGITVAPTAPREDEHGMVWHDYEMLQPQYMSRVFTPLARYQLFDRVNENRDWEIDFSRPRTTTWAYVVNHYRRAAQQGNFDFMRGDMSHVQMRPDGVPDRVDEHYDVLAAVKAEIRREVPHFAYLAESFLPARDVFQYGEELDHLDASEADAALGDLQATVVGDQEYLRRFRRYLDDLATRSCAPAYGVMTADKDDPRFDEFYRAGNELRCLTALLLTDMPSYTALGFEVRDHREEPADNEYYTKLFVFRERGDTNRYPSKARHSDEFSWGTNDALFGRLTRIRLFVESIWDVIAEADTRWLIPPDATTLRGTAVWTQQGEPKFVIATNADLDRDSGFFGIPALHRKLALELAFSTHEGTPAVDHRLEHNGYFHRIENLRPGEGRVYRAVPPVTESNASK